MKILTPDERTKAQKALASLRRALGEDNPPAGGATPATVKTTETTPGQHPDAVRMKMLEDTVKQLETQVRERIPSGQQQNHRVEQTDEQVIKNASLARVVQKLLKRCDPTDPEQWKDCPNEYGLFVIGSREKAASKYDVRSKALALGNTASLGAIIPQTLMTEIIPLLRSKYVIPALGVQVRDGLKGYPVTWNRHDTAATFAWVGENPASNFTASDQAMGQINLVPHEAVGLTDVSNRLLVQDPGAVESFIRADLGEGALRTKQIALIRGTGVGGQPQGVNAYPTGTSGATINTISLSGAVQVVMPLLVDMLAAIEARNLDSSMAKWLMHPNDWNDLCTTQVALYNASTVQAGTALPYFFAGDPSKGIPPMLLGRPVITTTDQTEGTVTLGIWEMAILGSWSGMEIAVSNEAGNRFDRNQTGIRLVLDADVALWQPGAFTTGTSLSV